MNPIVKWILIVAGAILALGIIVGVAVAVWPKGPAAPTTEPPATVVIVQTRIVVVEQTATPAPATDVPSVPRTAIPPANTAVAPSGVMPTGWVEVEVTPPQCTQGRRLVFNHDADGKLTDVFITWGDVEVLNPAGEVVEDLGKVMRLTQDPDGERLAVTGGWRKFRFEAQPAQTDVDALTEWVKNELARNSAFACDAVDDYNLSEQDILHGSSDPVANTEPIGWAELFPESRSFFPAGDNLQEFVVDHEGAINRVTIAWFWANFQKPSGNNGCTATVITDSGQTKMWYQGARRTWEFTGDPSKDDLQNLVRWWITTGLETEPNSVGCAATGKYTILWDSALAPSDPRGRP